MGLLNLLGLQRKPQPRPVMDVLSMPGPTDDFWYGPVSPANSSGIDVDENVALTYSACWAATRLYCGTMGMLPLNVYRSLPSGGAEIEYNHPLQRILHDEPNLDVTAMTFRAGLINQQINAGNCFAEIQRDEGGRCKALWPISCSRIPHENVRRVNGAVVYLVNNNDGTKTPIMAQDMLHVPSIIADDGYGRGVVENARLSIGFGIATEQHGAAYFGNGARPGVIIKGARFHKSEDSEEFRRQWEQVHGGAANHGKPGILPPDADITVLPFNAQDSQFLESRQHSVEEIARWYGVPPHLIGHLLRATFSNIEHQGIEFVKYSLMPWLKLWEQEIWRKLLTREEQSTYYAKFVVDALERGDKPSRTEANVKEFFNGMLTLNQWASREDMNPIGPLGDVHFVQQAMIPLEQAANGQQKPDAAADTTPKETPEQLLRAAIETYGVAVRSGLITPQLDDEEQQRKLLGLPPMSTEAKTLWEDNYGIRRPITLSPVADTPTTVDLPDAVDPNKTQGKQPFGGPPLATLEEHPSKPNDMPPEDMAAIRSEVEQLRTVNQQLASAMLRDVFRRTLSVEVNAVKRVAEKASKFDTRLREFYTTHAATIERNLLDPVTLVLSVTGDTRQPAEVVKTLAAAHVATSLEQLDVLLDCTADQLGDKVNECVSRWHEERTTVTV